MPARDDRGTGRPDYKMSRWDDEVKRARFGTGTTQRQRVQAKANAKRRQRDRASVVDGYREVDHDVHSEDQ